MRNTIRAAIVLAILPMPSMGFAQQAVATPDSADDYVCVFSGKCDAGEEEDVTRDAPAVKGFCLGCPDKGAVASASRKSGAVPAAASSQRQASVQAPPRRVLASRTSPAATLANVQRGTRADLRLSFEKGSAILTAESRVKAMKFAEALRRPELAGRRFMIEGHTDSAGGHDYNLDLSQRRARAVADFLADQGVSRDRLEVQGFAFDRPVPGQTAAAPQNRRVEAVLIS